jgi:hypothetical protein
MIGSPRLIFSASHSMSSREFTATVLPFGKTIDTGAFLKSREVEGCRCSVYGPRACSSGVGSPNRIGNTAKRAHRHQFILPSKQ